MPEIPNSRIRKLRTWVPGKRSSELIGEDENKNQITLINLASNDYLDLARHPLLIEAARQTLETDGAVSYTHLTLPVSYTHLTLPTQA